MKKTQLVSDKQTDGRADGLSDGSTGGHTLINMFNIFFKPLSIFIFSCRCNRGYTGNGLDCSRSSPTSSSSSSFSSSSSSSSSALPCDVANDCHLNAECLMDERSNRFRCRCNQGFQGDGYFCSISSCRLGLSGSFYMRSSISMYKVVFARRSVGPYVSLSFGPCVCNVR